MQNFLYSFAIFLAALFGPYSAKAAEQAPQTPAAQASNENRTKKKNRFATATGRATVRIVAAVSAGYERGKVRFKSSRWYQKRRTADSGVIFALE